jgi:hypothetical protein
MRRKVFAIVLLAVLATAVPAFASKGGKNTGTSRISLESYSDLRLGGVVGFDTTVVGLTGSENAGISVQCSQNEQVVYMEFDSVGTEFKLGGDSSPWLTNGGPASCEADLSAYGWKGGQESIRLLAQLYFNAAG